MSNFFDSSGILCKVPGDVIGGMSMTFPAPGPDQPAERYAEVDHPLGRVRITYKLSSHRHGKARMWSWQATFAEVVGAQ